MDRDLYYGLTLSLAFVLCACGGSGDGGTASSGGSAGALSGGSGGAATGGSGQGGAATGGSGQGGAPAGGSGGSGTAGEGGAAMTGGTGGVTGGGGSGGTCTPASTDGIPYSGTCTYADHCTDEYDTTFGATTLRQFCEGQSGTWSTTACDPSAWDIKCTQAVFGGVYIQFMPSNGICALGCEEPL